MDGVIDIWDYFYRQNEVAYSHKVGDAILSSISVQGSMQSGGGKLVAVGDVTGTVSLLEVCDSLACQQPNEKKAIDNMFEREMKQEKNLENREKELRRLRLGTNHIFGLFCCWYWNLCLRALDSESKIRESQDKRDNKDEKMEELLRKVDADFLAMIKEAEDDESRAVEVSPLEMAAEEK